MPLHIEMMRMGDDVRAELGVRFGGGVEHRELAERLIAVLDEMRCQRPRVAQLVRQQRDPRLLAEREIGHAGHRGIDQFGDGALMHGGILPHVEPGQMEAEAVHRATQQPQPPARDHPRIVGDQRTVEHVEIGLQFPDA